MLKGSPVVLCGRCIVRPEVPANPKPSDQVLCPVCGATETVERVLTQARHHATHLARRDLEERRIRSGAQLRNITPTRAPVKVLDWISGLSAE